MEIKLENLTIGSVRKAMLAGEFTAKDLASKYLEAIELKNKEINAYLGIYDDVIAQAEAADARMKAEGEKSPALCGIPFAIKDNILIKGKIASAASKMLENYKATYDATAIAKLKENAPVFLGRANMDEFAMGGSTENSAFGVVKNPYDVSRVAGGSSGGSVAAVAADMALVALGSDTGGSIREPASFCGLVGLKPTYGRVSRYGLMAMGSSLDQIGPITKTVEDARIVYEAIRGEDKYDSTSISDETYGKKEWKGKKGTVGVPRKLMEQGGIDKDVIDNFNDSIKKFADAGFEIVDVELPNASLALAVYYVIMPAEVSSNMARYDGVKYGSLTEGEDLLGDYLETRRAGFGKEVRRRILLGTYVLSTGYYDAYYNKANAARKLIAQDYENAFKKADIIITPTSPTPAFKIGEKTDDPVQMYLADVFTVTANLVGTPALSVPSGIALRDGKKLPLGIQLTAAHGQEHQLFEAGKRFLGEE